MRTKKVFLAPTIVIFLSLAACSSSSSNNEPDPESSTNTVPAEVNPPSQDPITLTSNNTNMDDGSTNTVVNGVDELIQNDPEGDTNNSIAQTTQLLINPDTSFGQLQLRVVRLAGNSLQALNQALNQGELLTAQQNNCIGAFDPALGEPLLAINCEQALSVSNVPIFAMVAELNNTPECATDLQNNAAENCSAVRAELTVNTLWITPQTLPGQPARPQPKAGASIQYDIEQDRLVVTNLSTALAGTFRCEYSISTGSPVDSSLTSNCDEQFARINDLIDEHLASAN